MAQLMIHPVWYTYDWKISDTYNGIDISATHSSSARTIDTKL